MLAIVWLLQRRLSRGSFAPRRASGTRGTAAVSRGTARARARAHDEITVVAKRGIGPKAQVAVVEIGGARYVLGITEGGVSMLDRIDAAASDDDTDAAPLPAPIALAPLNGAPTDAASATPAAAPASAPLPLRRAQLRADRADRAARTARPAAMTARDAAQVLRRALGA